ncbi:hypothetical protein CF328_g7660, partial [Tilletia controversa]
MFCFQPSRLRAWLSVPQARKFAPSQANSDLVLLIPPLPVRHRVHEARRPTLDASSHRPCWPQDQSEFTQLLSASRAQDGGDKPAAPSHSDSDGQLVIDDGADDDDEDGSSKPAAPPSHPLSQPAQPPANAAAATPSSQKHTPPTSTDKPTQELEPCFMEQLLEVCINLLFRSGFTVPWTDDQQLTPSSQNQETTSFVHLVIWYAGVGTSQELERTTRTHESHRVEVLRLLLVLLSKSMYIPLPSQRTAPNEVASYA